MDGTGQVDNLLDLEFRESAYRYYDESDIENTTMGLGWGEHRLPGFRPGLGYRLNDYMALSASYSWYGTKKGAERWTDPEDELPVSFRSEFEMSALQLLAHYYPFPESNGFHFIVGVERVSFRMNLEHSVSERLTGDQEGETFGFVFGGGLDVPLHERWIAYAATSVTRSDDKFTIDENTEEEWDILLGGLGLELGVKFYLGF
jgi:hypothetical protein